MSANIQLPPIILSVASSCPNSTTWKLKKKEVLFPPCLFGCCFFHEDNAPFPFVLYLSIMRDTARFESNEGRFGRIAPFAGAVSSLSTTTSLTATPCPSQVSSARCTMKPDRNEPFPRSANNEYSASIQNRRSPAWDASPAFDVDVRSAADMSVPERCAAVLSMVCYLAPAHKEKFSSSRSSSPVNSEWATPFVAPSTPSISIGAYVDRLHKYLVEPLTQMSKNSPVDDDPTALHVVALALLDKYSQQSGNQVTLNNVHRLFLTALLVSVKMHAEIPGHQWSNKHVALVGGVQPAELNHMETTFLAALDWNATISVDEYHAESQLHLKLDSVLQKMQAAGLVY